MYDSIIIQERKENVMQIILAIIVAVVMQTPIDVFVAPNGEIVGAVECVQCGGWYMPEADYMWSCPGGCD